MLDAGLMATVNSDDPAYFGGYLLDNYSAVRDALKLDTEDIVTLAKNSITASFADEEEKVRWIEDIDSVARQMPA